MWNPTRREACDDLDQDPPVLAVSCGNQYQKTGGPSASGSDGPPRAKEEISSCMCALRV